MKARISRPRRSSHRPLFLLGLIAAAACSESGAPILDCTSEARGVLRLDVIDSVTGLPAAAGAHVRLGGGPFVDSFSIPDTATGALARFWFEDRMKAGTYSLQVTKPGYATWTQSNIRVTADACHVTTFDYITARLRR